MEEERTEFAASALTAAVGLASIVSAYDPTNLTKVLFAAATELQKAVEITESAKLIAQNISSTIRYLAPLYGDLLRLSTSGLVSKDFDTRFRDLLLDAIKELQAGRNAVYEFIALHYVDKLRKAADVEEELAGIYERLKLSIQIVTAYNTTALLETQLRSMDQVAQLNEEAHSVLEQLRTLSVAPSEPKMVRKIAKLAVGLDSQRRKAVLRMVGWCDKGKGRELAQSGALSALWQHLERQGGQLREALELELLEKLVAADPDGGAAFLHAGGSRAQGLVDLVAAVTRPWAVRHKLKGHMGPVSCVAFAHHALPAGPSRINLLASGSHDTTVRLWDADSGACLATLQGHSNQVTSLSFCKAAPGTLLASASQDYTIRLWDCSLLQGNGEASTAPAAAAAAANAAQQAADDDKDGDDDGDAAEAAGSGGGGGGAAAVAAVGSGAAPAGSKTSGGGAAGAMINGACLFKLTGHTDCVSCVCFAPEGASNPGVLASGSWDKTIKLWDSATGKCLSTLEGHKATVSSLSFSPVEPHLLASASDDQSIHIWDTRSGVREHKWFDKRGWVSSVCCSPSQASTVASGGDGGTVYLWDTSSTCCAIAKLKGHRSHVNTVQFSPLLPSLLVSASSDDTLRLWDAGSGVCSKHVLGCDGYSATSVEFSALDAALLASGSTDDLVRLWQMEPAAAPAGSTGK